MAERPCFAASVSVCWHVLVMHSLVAAVMRWGQGRWDIGDGNGPYPCCETLSGTGGRWGRAVGEEGGKKGWGQHIRSLHWDAGSHRCITGCFSCEDSPYGRGFSPGMVCKDTVESAWLYLCNFFFFFWLLQRKSLLVLFFLPIQTFHVYICACNQWKESLVFALVSVYSRHCLAAGAKEFFSSIKLLKEKKRINSLKVPTCWIKKESDGRSLLMTPRVCGLNNIPLLRTADLIFDFH